jgi:hypothetical protein
VREGLRLGVVWLVISVAIDAPLMLFGGPMLAQRKVGVESCHVCRHQIPHGEHIASSIGFARTIVTHS